ncbi:MAG: hypothetical protein MJY82_08625 [Fibrobacter sp.]|nr:hypothetical protein [Fibrobacter sp.]
MNILKREYHKNGELCSVANVVDNLFEGTEKIFHPNGQLQCKHVYVNGRVIDGTVAVLRPDSTLDCIEYWKDGYCRCFTRNKVLICEFGLFNGKFRGRYKNYYENGSVNEEVCYNEYGRDGMYKAYDYNGQLIEETWPRRRIAKVILRGVENTGEFFCEKTAFLEEKEQKRKIFLVCILILLIFGIQNAIFFFVR